MAKSALIVDDSATMRQMVRDTLRCAGFAVTEASNGEEAIRRLDGREVHLIITDFNMPVMNGPTLVKRLRSSPTYRFTPILMLTTETAEDRKREGREAGATGWILKPFDPTRLIQVVHKLVP